MIWFVVFREDDNDKVQVCEFSSGERLEAFVSCVKENGGQIVKVFSVP